MKDKSKNIAGGVKNAIYDVFTSSHPKPNRDWFLTLVLFTVLFGALLVVSALLYIHYEFYERDEVTITEADIEEEVVLSEDDVRMIHQIFQEKQTRFELVDEEGWGLNDPSLVSLDVGSEENEEDPSDEVGDDEEDNE